MKEVEEEDGGGGKPVEKEKKQQINKIPFIEMHKTEK